MVIKIDSLLGQLKKYGILSHTLNITKGDYTKTVLYPLTDSRELSGFSSSELRREQTTAELPSFICIRGNSYDGHEYADQIVRKGVNVLIVEKELTHLSLNNEVKQIIVFNSRKALASLAVLYFNDPSAKLRLIGVTGTNGKTSIVKIIESILIKNGMSAGTIGTLGYSINGEHFPLERTTPDITELNQILKEMVNKDVKYVVMEVSSHSLNLDRVYCLKFDLAIFTNLTRDHLDFHSTMENYYLAKKKLFTYLKEKNGVALINTDDSYGKRLFREIASPKYSISIKKLQDKAIEQSSNSYDEQAEVSFSLIKNDLSETDFELKFNESFADEILNEKRTLFRISTPLLGEHNAFNLSAAISTVKLINNEIALEKIISSLPTSISGRLQRVENQSGFSCYIDYAHTPDAIENVCKTLRSILSGIFAPQNSEVSFKAQRRLITVVGAGGDRDRGKRKEITDSALKYSDLVILTSDNPRKENPAVILFDMVEHLPLSARYWIVTNRREAIKTAVSLAAKEDVVLIAGKGHENYQELAEERIPFNDYQEAQNAILRRDKGNKPKSSSEQGTNLFNKIDYEEASPSTIKLTIPLDLLQLRLLMGFCSINTFSATRKKQNQPQQMCDCLRSYDPVLSKEILSSQNRKISYVSSDTRTINNDSVFFALKGENFDGHDFVSEALKFENNWAVVDEDYVFPKKSSQSEGSFPDNSQPAFEEDAHSSPEKLLIRVSDTQTAFGILAKKYRSLFKAEVIAITGSSGKSTTKEYCYNILSRKSNVLKNHANENNLLGVSKTILRLKPETDYAIIEIGSNHFGEIKVLADTCQPDIGIITNIGPSHLEFFGDLIGVFREKSSMLKKVKKFALIPANHELFDKLAGNLIRIDFERKKYLSYLEKVVGVELISIDKERSVFLIDQEKYSIASDIKFNVYNAAFAVVLALKLSLSKTEIQVGLEDSLPLKDRMEVFESGGRTVISDCYNANPVSMKAAIDYWLAYEPERSHVAILGDMLELGENSASFHREIGEYLREHISNTGEQPRIIGVGNQARHFGGDQFFKNTAELISSGFLDSVDKKAVILLKASHGVHLEKIKGRL